MVEGGLEYEQLNETNTEDAWTSHKKKEKFKNPFDFPIKSSAKIIKNDSSEIKAGMQPTSQSSEVSLRRSQRLMNKRLNEDSESDSISSSSEVKETTPKPKRSQKDPNKTPKKIIEHYVPDKNDKFYNVVYTHPNWRDETMVEGIVVVSPNVIELYSPEGKVIVEEPASESKHRLRPGATLILGKIEVAVDGEVPYKDFASGKCFISKFNNDEEEMTFTRKKKKNVSIPEGSLVLDEENKIFVIPHLAKNLREHQKIGVKFMYDCIAGNKSKNYYGCILADTMGLGKTIQTIALLYPLLRKDPKGESFLDKSIVVVPSSLLLNWANEFQKWLGPYQLGVVVCIGNQKEKEEAIEKFSQESTSVLIISYETFRTYTEALVDLCDLLICDEGHRLKNLKTQTAMTLNEVNCRRRIILTGTPLQNKLLEFYSCISFVNPDILGDKNTFIKIFSDPIGAGQDPNCSEKVKELALQRSDELCKITSTFILRRTGTLLEKYLTPRSEYLIFCKLSELQTQIYQAYIQSKFTTEVVENVDAGNALNIITSLRKISNHPDLIYNHQPKSPNLFEAWTVAMNLFPQDYENDTERCKHSSKMMLFDFLVKKSIEIGDKVILASNFNKTLDLYEELCKQRQYSFCRLDGSTTVNQRLKIVDKFNSPGSSEIVFLLSCKAGGVGLNLVGANRLIIADPDWNPSNDKQVMGRIWRDGQSKPVYIYRLFSTGTIDEKIFQRQHAKETLSSTIIDSKQFASSFSKRYLKELFTLSPNCMSFEDSGIDLHKSAYKGSLLSEATDLIDVVQIKIPDWKLEERVIEEKLDFVNSQAFADNKRKLEDSDGDEDFGKKLKLF
ncbi:unnamed protein product [Blepharisma stoltei]|uniref:DNA repair and recombination protein RAD54 n=1 Tax=Blepharisma stoltei TaxID=1481888 RepID=A0AAU9JE38_9CILI|nr:unnamed protein product [Blepharisma stoltei]